MKVKLPPNFDNLEQEKKLKEFGSWKLTLITALLHDPILLPSDFKVAVAVLQFMNSETGMIFPAIETIAEVVSMSPRNVEKCLGRLRERGWIKWDRGNRQLSNVYRFDLTNVDAMMDRRAMLWDTVRERRAYRRKNRSDMNLRSPQELRTRTTVPLPTGTAVPLATRTPVPSNTLVEHPKRTPQEDMGIECEAPLAARRTRLKEGSI